MLGSYVDYVVVRVEKSPCLAKVRCSGSNTSSLPALLWSGRWINIQLFSRFGLSCDRVSATAAASIRHVSTSCSNQSLTFGHLGVARRVSLVLERRVSRERRSVVIVNNNCTYTTYKHVWWLWCLTSGVDKWAWDENGTIALSIPSNSLKIPIQTPGSGLRVSRGCIHGRF